jgi:hypothetical protein
MAVAIQETIVTPAGDETVVQLRIADESQPDDRGAISLVLTLRVKSLPNPTLARLQRSALKAAGDHIRDLLQPLGDLSRKDVDA